MRIAFVVHGYPPEESAGVELVAREQAEALARRGHAVAVFARSYARESETLRETRVGEIPVWRAACPPGAVASFEETYDNRAFAPAFERFLDAVQPDVVHFQHLVMLSPGLLYLTRARGIASVLALHDAFYLCHRLFLLDQAGARCPGPDAGLRCVACLADLGGSPFAVSRFDFMARAVAQADAVIAPSRGLAERYARELPFLDGAIEVIDPGLARAPTRAPERRSGRGTAGDPLRLLFIGTCLPHKGLDLLVEAAAQLDAERFRLAIYGEEVAGGEAFVAAQRRATGALPVDWLGRFPADRLDAVLAAHDVLVLPSRCDESYSRVVREARSAGLAVVAPRSGGPAEVLRDGADALLVEPASASDLRAALDRLIGDPALLARLAAAPAAWPTVDEAAARLGALYARAIERVRARGQGRRAGLPRVSVAYVTKNGARDLEASLRAVERQRGPFELVEVIAVDSGSNDATLDILARHRVRVLRIPPHEFGHGRTRNLAAQAARGDVVVFLTQDAEPADDRWLAELIAPLERDPLIAGVSSRHLPRPGCHPMEWRQLAEFPLFAPTGVRVASARGRSEGARQPELDRWFSNNASAIRRSLIERHPFPEVEFAEDQAWAQGRLDAGYRIALANDSVIFHSHAYSPWTNLQRHFDHACAMREALGRADELTVPEAVRAALRETRRDIDFWAERRARSRARVAARWGVPAVAYHLGAFSGRWLGAHAGRLPAGVRRRLSLHRQRVEAR